PSEPPVYRVAATSSNHKMSHKMSIRGAHPTFQLVMPFVHGWPVESSANGRKAKSQAPPATAARPIFQKTGAAWVRKAERPLRPPAPLRGGRERRRVMRRGGFAFRRCEQVAARATPIDSLKT